MPFRSARRILFKISGQFLKGGGDQGLCWSTLDRLCQHLAQLKDYQWVLVVGGGNFFRGTEGRSYCGDAISDTMGMMATHLNALGLVAGLERSGMETVLFTARAVEGMGRSFDAWEANKILNQGKVVLCSGGLGHGGMTTDTAAVVRACELSCDVILKGTQVAGVYAQDPLIFPDAFFYPHISYGDVLTQQLQVMDLAAIALALQCKKQMVVFSLSQGGILGLFENRMPYSLLTP